MGSDEPKIVASSAAELAAGEALLEMLQSGMSAPASHKREAAQDVVLNLARNVQMRVRSGDAEDSGEDDSESAQEVPDELECVVR